MQTETQSVAAVVADRIAAAIVELSGGESEREWTSWYEVVEQVPIDELADLRDLADALASSIRIRILTVCQLKAQ